MHGVGLTVVGGGHSGRCLWPNVVLVNMGAFNQVHILTAGEDGGDSGSNFGSLVVAEAGCKTGDIVRKTMTAGVTVPLGARPSLGAGLWLQGGIRHLARLHGLACDAISVPLWSASTLARSSASAVYQANTGRPVPFARKTNPICYGRLKVPGPTLASWSV